MVRFLHVTFLFGIGSVIACSGSNLEIAPGADTSTTGDGAASDTSGADASGGDSTGTDTSLGDGIASDGGKPDGPVCDRSTFPTFIRGCTNDESCSFGLHALDCCGSQAAIGFNHSEKTRFDAAEKAYEAVCPVACGCPAGPITTDSGLTTTDPSRIVVQCVAGPTGINECKTTVK